jgi:hypothetical protein
MVADTFWLLLQAIKMTSYIKGLYDLQILFYYASFALYDFSQFSPDSIGIIVSSLPSKQVWKAALLYVI